MTRNGKTNHFRESVGAEHVAEGIVASPFDYEKNVDIRIAADCPEPMGKDRLPYLNYLAEALHACASAMSGGTLALFTNYRDLRHCHDVLRPRWQKLRRSLYAQGEGHSRVHLRQRMLEEGDVLLLGAESFWKGFDAPGQALSQIIITRLPFDNPEHPLLEAKAERIEAMGESPFRQITLPVALTRFRQGIGRLVRTRTDHGGIVILDSRILRKSYGKEFLNELPKRTYRVFRLEEILEKSHPRGY